jgi:hypothetical protein
VAWGRFIIAAAVQGPRDRPVTFRLTLLTRSARRPACALRIGAFVPQREDLGAFNLTGVGAVLAARRRHLQRDADVQEGDVQEGTCDTGTA